jgi:S-layer family protein
VLKQVRWLFFVTVAVSWASAAAAADSVERIRVTDPAALASMGFPPDAIVYTLPSPAEATNPDPQETYGASSTMVAHTGVQFNGRFSSYSYDSLTGAGDVGFLGGDTFADAQLQLPSGAVWENTRYWVVDASAADIGLFAFQSCLPAAAPGPPVNLQLASGTSTGATGEQTILITPTVTTVINNNTCIYWIRVRFGAAGQVLRKARTQYRLQVSPAPAVASFPADVPTSHPFFRFVEAMALSGLTGGCGPGMFCPDTPVTRGQLSVFLAVALGLHFPN